MKNFQMELEIANRKIKEFQQQAARDEMVKQYKKARKHPKVSFWQTLFRRFTPKSSSESVTKSYGPQAPFYASKDE